MPQCGFWHVQGFRKVVHASHYEISAAPHLTGAGEQESGASALGEAKHVHGANEAGLDGLNGVVPAPTDDQ